MKTMIVKLATIALLVPALVTQCPFLYQFNTPDLRPGLCAESCFNPLYDNCPSQIAIIEPRPQYCGLGKDGIWRNYTYTCEVCMPGEQRKLGYYFGSCRCSAMSCGSGTKCINGNCQAVPTCKTIKCPAGYKCIDDKCVQIVVVPQCTPAKPCPSGQVCDMGKCRPATCDDISCSDPLDTCEYGICFRKYDFFCSKISPQIERHYCPITLPTNQECPWYPPPLPPAKTVCGVTLSGDLLDFQSICQACQRSHIEYVYTQSCSQIPIACDPATEVCTDGKCVAINPCAGVNCPHGKECNNGLCIPVCHCQPGYHCQNYICVPDVVDPCLGVYCYYGTHCKNGQCVPDVVDPCQGVHCSYGTHCKNGQCVPDVVDPCQGVHCSPGTHCKNGHCVVTQPDQNYGRCFTNRDCNAPYVCIGSFCKRCMNDWNCDGGQCVNGECKA